MQLPIPPPPGDIVPVPIRFDVIEFALLYFLGLEMVLFALPEKWRNTILQIAFPFLRRDGQENR